MSAQRELADLLAISERLFGKRHAVGEAAEYYNRLGRFMNSHGPALAELIEALGAVNAATSEDQFLAAKLRQMTAYKKLTEPKA